jgi:hypothetical protein
MRRLFFALACGAASIGFVIAVTQPAHAAVSTMQPSRSGTAPAQSIFQPPAGWQHVGAGGDGLGTWLHHGDPVYSQNVSVQATHFDGKLSDIVNKEITYIQGAFANVAMKPIEQTTVCGNHPAAYFKYTFDATNTQVVAEQIVTIYGSTAYTAKYNHAADQQADTSAQHSLRTLCGGSPPHGK